MKDETLPTGSESIMVIDDELAIALINQRYLESLGYNVTSYVDSRAAYEDFRAHPEAYDLVITDQAMPMLSGIELAGRLLAIRPDVRILLLTGYSATVTREKAKKSGVREFLMKPVAREKLAYTVRQVLDAQ